MCVRVFVQHVFVCFMCTYSQCSRSALITIDYNADSDPDIAFYLNADPDPVSKTNADPCMHAHPYPDHGKTKGT
jgi:hypothetical protein